MAQEWGDEFDDGPRYGRPQHERPEETRDTELYGQPQHRVADEKERRDESGSPMSLRWVDTE